MTSSKNKAVKAKELIALLPFDLLESTAEQTQVDHSVKKAFWQRNISLITDECIRQRSGKPSYHGRFIQQQ